MAQLATYTGTREGTMKEGFFFAVSINKVNAERVLTLQILKIAKTVHSWIPWILLSKQACVCLHVCVVKN